MAGPSQIPQLPHGTKTFAIGERGKLIAAGVALGVLLFLPFLLPGAGGEDPIGVVKPVQVDISAFVPEPKILAKAKDRTASDRAQLEEEPLAHLLEKSLDMTPLVAKAMTGKPRPVSYEELQQSSDDFRGWFLSFKGTLEYFSQEQTQHPSFNYRVYQGRLSISNTVPGKTEDAPAPQRMLFFVSKPLPEGVKKGDFVQIRGFFLKLKDEHLLATVEKAPILVGKSVRPATPDWEAVAELDRTVLGRVQVATPVPGSKLKEWRNGADLFKGLEESEDVPLWHLVSYARNHAKRLTPEERAKAEFFENKEQHDRFKKGEFPQGDPIRIRGTLITARVFPADTNPVGVKSWTQAWVRVPRMAGKVLPIWIPHDIRATLELDRRDNVQCYAYFYKNYLYDTRIVEGSQAYTPIFVAASLDRFTLKGDPFSDWLGFTFVGVILLVMVIIFLMYRSNSRQSQAHETAMVERRRRRRLSGA